MTELNPYISKIFIYPIKSLDGVNVQRSTLLLSGGLKGDREFAIVDEAGVWMNGKRTPTIHRLCSKFDLDARTISLSIQDSNTSETFHLDGDRPALERWLSNYFQMSVRLVQNCETGFPDDTNSPGPTVVSAATLDAIASWYPGMDVREVWRRFRSNIEISGVPAFWEDHLFTDASDGVPFQVGSVQFVGVNPCQRCVVVTRDPQTGEPSTNFQKVFVVNRRETLPSWVDQSPFNHFFRLAINTRLSPTNGGKEIQLGDRVSIVEADTSQM